MSSNKKSSKGKNTPPVFSARVETITPAVAQKYLAMMPINRRQRPRVTEQWTAEMKAGRWKLTGEAIKFNTRGELVDGQHRLEAIIASGVTVQILVCRNIPDDAFMELDTGVTRTPGDLLTVAGFDYSTQVASTLKVIQSIYQMEAGAIAPSSMARQKLPPQVLLEWAHSYGPQLVNAVRRIMSKQARTVCAPPSVFSGLYYIFSEHNKKGADQFFDLLIDGIGFEHGKQDPVYILHRKLVQYNQDKHKLRTNFYRAALTIKAWNAFQARLPVTDLRYGESEAFPMIDRRKHRASEKKSATA